MHYRTFGRLTGLRVSEYALGTANFGVSDVSTGAAGAREIFEAFAAAGGTTIDTSDIYQGGQAESILGELLDGRRDEFVVITKYGATRDRAARPTVSGNSRKIMMRSIEASLRRLRTDHVDLFMAHLPDGTTPVDEILAGLDDLVRSGKIRYGGLSNFPAWRVSAAAVRAGLQGSAPPVGIETEYSLAERSAERELLPMAEAYGVGALLYSPLAGGLLTGKYRRGGTGRLSARGDAGETTGRRTRIVDELLAITTEIGTSPARVALAWLRGRAASSATALIPIVGPRTTAQLDEYLGSLDLALDADQLRRLDEVSAPGLGTPHTDVVNAIAGGYDGDRGLLEPAAVPVI
ncbi:MULTISPECIES: aldo/keto reductase [Actinoplanes]|uniref:aldo/keto reductase n=1 Tax=Actinoplanes TaxID=1865 RepID=UPI0005F2FE71|nr:MULTISPECIES: aldo/keto reductase [Actinoplanes]GLY00526.1 oxidoreductase [Actinoplanes sp. NBRC 101535]